MTGGGPPIRSLAETGEVLHRPHALEDVALSEVPVLATDLTSAADLALDHREVLGSRLRSVRAVTVGVLAGPVAPALAELADAHDIVVGRAGPGSSLVETSDPEGAVELVAGAVAAHPQASVAAAQLLRFRAYEQVPLGLVLESLTYSMLQSGPEFARGLRERGPMEVPTDRTPPVAVTSEGTTLALTLDRPQRANAFTAAMRDLLVEALRTAAADPTIEGVIIRGAGRSFCSGGDLAEFGSAPDPATGHAVRLARSPAWWLHELARDVRVHLHGACVGAGIELPAFAGTVLAAPDTTVRLPEVGMGLVPGAGGTVSIPRRIGPHRAAYLAVTGVTIDAQQALAWGLVDRIEREPAAPTDP